MYISLNFLQKKLTRKPDFLRGFSLIEIVIATAMLSIFLVSISLQFKKILEVGILSTRSIQTNFLLEEGVEAVKSLRDEGWTGKIANLRVGTVYYLSWNGAKWTTTVAPQVIDSMFTRSFTIASTTRDVNYDIATSGGTDDIGARKVTMSVSWTPKNSSAAITDSIETYIMNIFAN